MRTHCASASLRRTNWRGFVRSSTTCVNAASRPTTPSAGFGRTRRDLVAHHFGHDLAHEHVLAVEQHLGDALADVVECTMRTGLARPARVDGRVPPLDQLL